MIARTNDICGHLDRRHYARGTCQPCYCGSPEYKAKRNAYDATPEARARKRDRRAMPEAKAKQKAYKARSEVRARAKASTATPEYKAERKAYRTSPRVRAIVYKSQTGVPEARTFPWFLMSEADRLCWLCGENGATDLDHNHITLEIRGWAHHACNVIEGMVGASPRPAQLLATLAKVYYDEERRKMEATWSGSLMAF